jgi:hypothetical protein
LVTVGQTFGDSIFDHQPLLNGSPIGGIYHVMLGASGTPDNGDGIHQPGEAYQGAYTGVLNMTPPAGSTTTSPNAAPRFPNRSPAPNRNPAADIPEVQWRPTP